MSQRRCMGCMSITENYFCEHCGTPANRQNGPHQLPVGTMLQGKYQVGRVLGQGGFGITYLGWDTYLDIPVAIKEFYPQTIVSRDSSQSFYIRCNMETAKPYFENGKARFLREAKALAKFDEEPAIVRIKNFFPENDTAYIIMEYVPGVSLQRYVATRGGHLRLEETLQILKPVMNALSVVHQTGMIHRDISPDNIILRIGGCPKLLDFGAVRFVGNPQADQPLSRPTEAIVKHGFAPMEQYQNNGSLGPWTDVYAMSATIYYCATGCIPTDAPGRMMDGKDPEWEGILGITAKQKRALKRGMALQTTDRITSVAELMRELYSDTEPYEREDGYSIENVNITLQADDISDKDWSRSNSRQLSVKTERNPWLRQEMMRWEEAQENTPGVETERILRIPNTSSRSSGRWVQENGGSYYYDAKGSMITGWNDISGNRYYFGSDGQMRVGWRYISGDMHYFGEDGVMRTGWQIISGETYYFGFDGVMRTGTQRIDGKIYEFRADGRVIG